MKRAFLAGLIILGIMLFAGLAFAAEPGEGMIGVIQYTVLGAGLAIGLGAIGSGVGMGHAIGGTVEGMSRNPEVGGRLLTTMIIGLAMIESLTIYALVIALILLFGNPYVK
jgi:F-type H+-transporting ATPase subunit c